MERIELRDLPRWSQWPERLLGLVPWSTPERTIEKIEAEYNRDKYERCLDFLNGAGGAAGPDEVKTFELGASAGRQICFSVGPDLFQSSVEDVRRQYYALLADRLAPAIEKCRTVVELGCGYGYNLWMLHGRWPDRHFAGGEYAAKAVALAEKLYAGGNGPRVEQFNFYESPYTLLEKLEGPIVVFTSHALEQLPRAAGVVDALASSAKVVDVFHFEPVYELQADQELMAMMRRRYIEANDYNRDLLTAVRAHPQAELLSVEENIFGLNPLNPTSVIHWRPGAS